jgi:hypothetical protein
MQVCYDTMNEFVNGNNAMKILIKWMDFSHCKFFSNFYFDVLLEILSFPFAAIEIIVYGINNK